MPQTFRGPPGLEHGEDQSSPSMAADANREVAVAEVLAAVAEPNRLRLLRVLLEGERCVTQCMIATGLSQSSASKHLIRLIDAGLVERERIGRRNYHRLTDAERIHTLLDAATAAAAATAR